MSPAQRVGIAGPLLGGNPGWVTSQGEVLAAHLEAEGISVQTTSSVPERGRRALDTLLSVRRWRASVDLVVVLVFSGPAFRMAELAVGQAWRSGLPVVSWLHGGDLPGFAERHPGRVDRLLGRSRRVVAPTSYLAGLAPDRTTVVPNIVPDPPNDGPRPGPGPGGTRLLWMRTFHALYRPELAVDVVDRLREDHPEVSLTMAGQDKGSVGAVRARLRERALEGQVRVVGFLDPGAKLDAFRSHDVFLNTTSVDNAPVSLLEAAGHGLPIVSTPAGGIPELLPDGEAALLAEDAPALAHAVHRILTSPELAERLSDGAREVARRSTWASVGPQWRELLDEVADRG